MRYRKITQTDIPAIFAVRIATDEGTMRISYDIKLMQRNPHRNLFSLLIDHPLAIRRGYRAIFRQCLRGDIASPLWRNGAGNIESDAIGDGIAGLLAHVLDDPHQFARQPFFAQLIGQRGVQRTPRCPSRRRRRGLPFPS